MPFKIQILKSDNQHGGEQNLPNHHERQSPKDRPMSAKSATENRNHQGHTNSKALDFFDATVELMKEFDRLFNKYVRKWLRLPHDCPNILINGPIAKGGLGIQNMHENICGRRLDRYLRFNNVDDDPYEGDKQVDELKNTMKHPECIQKSTRRKPC